MTVVVLDDGCAYFGRRKSSLLEMLTTISGMSLPGKAHTTTKPIKIAQDFCREALIVGEDGHQLLRKINIISQGWRSATNVFVEIMLSWQVGDVQVRVLLVAQLLELLIGRIPGPFCLIAPVEESADAILPISIVVVFDEAKSLAKTILLIDHRFCADYRAESGSVGKQHLIRRVGVQAADINIGGVGLVLQACFQSATRLVVAENGRDGTRNSRALRADRIKVFDDVLLLFRVPPERRRSDVLGLAQLLRRWGSPCLRRVVGNSNLGVDTGGMGTKERCLGTILLVGRKRSSARCCKIGNLNWLLLWRSVPYGALNTCLGAISILMAWLLYVLRLLLHVEWSHSALKPVLSLRVEHTPIVKVVISSVVGSRSMGREGH